MISLAEKVTVRHIERIERPGAGRETTFRRPGGKVISYLNPRFASPDRIGILLNSVALTPEEAREKAPRPGDEVIFYRIPTGASFFLGLALLAIGFGLSYYSAQANKPSRSRFDESPTYGFNGLQNTVRPGTRIPIVYGEHRVAGHLLSQTLSDARNAPSIDNVESQNGILDTLIGLSSGPIDSVSEIQIDGNDASNYKGISTETRFGTLHQAPISGFLDVETQAIKDQAITKAGGAQTFQTQGEVDAFEIVLAFNQGMFRITGEGKFRGTSASFQVEFKEVSAIIFSTAPNIVVSKRTNQPFKIFWQSPRLTRGQYDVRITRLTADDPGDNSVVTVATIFSVSDILAEEISYPGIALLGVRQLPTNQVSGRAPNYTCLVRGRKVKIYTSKFNFTEEWSDNPAWCLLDFLLDELNGLGNFIVLDDIELESFQDWAAFCDELVDVQGGAAQEKRASLNLVVDGSLSAIETIKQMTATGRAFFAIQGNRYAVVVDRDDEPVQKFSMGRIGQLSYQVTLPTRQDKPNYFVGRYWNKDLDYDEDSLPIEDPLLEQEDRIRESEINLVGTTSTGQANRLLNYYILGQRFNRRIVRFEAFVDSIAVEAGDLIFIAHDVSGIGFSGILRQVNLSGTEMTLDREVTIEAGKSYELTVGFPDDRIEVAMVGTAPETTDKIQVAASWSDPPRAGDHYSFGEVGKSVAKYRVLSITRDPNHPLKRVVTAREHHAEVFEDDITAIPAPSVTTLPDPNRIPPDVTELRLNERQSYQDDGSLIDTIDVHYNLPVAAGISAKIYWREVTADDSNPWLLAGTSDTGFFSISEDVETPAITYEVSVVTVSRFGIHKHPEDGVITSIVTAGVTRLPDDVTGFTVDRTFEGLAFTWNAIDPVVNFDLAVYEVRFGPEWETAQLVGTTENTELRIVGVVKSLTGTTNTYLLKAQNTAGNYSQNEASVVFTVDPRINENIILTQQEDPGWTGTRVNATILSGELVFDQGADGSYTTAKFQVTTGNAVRTIVSTFLDTILADTLLTWDNPDVGNQTWDSEFAKTTTWSASGRDDVSIRLEMRFSTLTSADIDFGPWQARPQNFEVQVKWAQARLIVTIQKEIFKVTVKKFRMFFDVPDVIDSAATATPGAGTIAVLFNRTYNQAPRVVGIVLNSTAGDEVVTSAITNTGFTLGVRNAGVFVARTVHWTAVGF